MSMMMRRGMMVPKAPGGLPAEYLAVQYIESTGTQCIDTGVVPDSSTDVLLTKGVTSGNYLNCLFGANSSAYNQYAVNAIGAYFYGRNDYFPNSINPAGTITIVGGKIYYNDTLLLDYSETTGQSSQNLVLFGRTTNQGVYERFISMKVYAFKMWQNSVLIRDMIPCIRISDSKPGMYDLVGRQFYTNQGTGEFLYGENLIPNLANWVIKDSSGGGAVTKTADNTYEFTGTGKTNYSVYVMANSRQKTFSELVGKNVAIIVELDDVSGAITLAGGIDTTASANPTSANNRTGFHSIDPADIATDGVHIFTGTFNQDWFGNKGESFSTSDLVGASFFFVSTGTSTATLKRFEMYEIA